MQNESLTQWKPQKQQRLQYIVLKNFLMIIIAANLEDTIQFTKSHNNSIHYDSIKKITDLFSSNKNACDQIRFLKSQEIPTFTYENLVKNLHKISENTKKTNQLKNSLENELLKLNIQHKNMVTQLKKKNKSLAQQIKDYKVNQQTRQIAQKQKIKELQIYYQEEIKKLYLEIDDLNKANGELAKNNQLLEYDKESTKKKLDEIINSLNEGLQKIDDKKSISEIRDEQSGSLDSQDRAQSQLLIDNIKQSSEAKISKEDCKKQAENDVISNPRLMIEENHKNYSQIEKQIEVLDKFENWLREYNQKWKSKSGILISLLQYVSQKVMQNLQRQEIKLRKQIIEVEKNQTEPNLELEDKIAVPEELIKFYKQSIVKLEQLTKRLKEINQ